MRVHTEAVQFKADGKLLAFIEKKLSKLDTFYDRIIDADVILRLENSGQIRDKVAEVRLRVPGGVLFARETQKTFEASIDQLIPVLKRQLIRHKERTTGRSR